MQEIQTDNLQISDRKHSVSRQIINSDNLFFFFLSLLFREEVPRIFCAVLLFLLLFYKKSGIGIKKTALVLTFRCIRGIIKLLLFFYKGSSFD